MNLKLQGKIALVTGSGSPIGYGRAIATTLAEEGCDVVCADLNLAWAEETAGMIEGLGRQALAVKVDVSDRASVDAMVQAAVERFDRIDILVNNAGVSSPDKPFMAKTKADWDLDIGVNLYGQMNVAQAVIPHMSEQRYGRIINTSGGQGIPTISTYGAAKAGVEAFTHSLALEVAPLGHHRQRNIPRSRSNGIDRDCQRGAQGWFQADVGPEAALHSAGCGSGGGVPRFRRVQLHGRSVAPTNHLLKEQRVWLFATSIESRAPGAATAWPHAPWTSCGWTSRMARRWCDIPWTVSPAGDVSRSVPKAASTSRPSAPGARWSHRIDGP